MIKKAYNVDINVGDVVLGGKFKNQRMVVKEFGTNDIGQPTVNGKSLLAVRIEKTLPDDKKSSETLAKEIADMNTESYREKIAAAPIVKIAKGVTIGGSFKALSKLPGKVYDWAGWFGANIGKPKPATVKEYLEVAKDPNALAGMIREGVHNAKDYGKYFLRKSSKALGETFGQSIPAIAITTPLIAGTTYGAKKLQDYYKNKDKGVEKVSGLLDTIYQNSFNDEIEKLSQENNDQKSLESKVRNLKRVGDYVGNLSGNISIGSGVGSLINAKIHPKTSLALSALSLGGAIGNRVGAAMINRGKIYSTALQAARENVLSPDEKDFLIIKDPHGKAVKEVYNALPSDKRNLYKKRMADLYGWKLKEFTNKQD